MAAAGKEVGPFLTASPPTHPKGSLSLTVVWPGSRAGPAVAGWFPSTARPQRRDEVFASGPAGTASPNNAQPGSLVAALAIAIPLIIKVCL